MPNITIDNIPISVPEGTTILEAAAAVGIQIPTLCHLQGQKPLASCMVCLVRIDGAAKLTPSCAALVREGMVVESEIPEIIEARRIALELLLGDHRGDCAAPCQDSCPSHMNIPRMISHLAKGDFRSAVAVIKEHIALPAVLGRVCAAMCERGCRRARLDAAVSIKRLERYVADIDLSSADSHTPGASPPTGKEVHVVGAGPAGLSAAYYLARAGHRVKLYANSDLPGGTLRAQELSDSLPKDVLDAEINLLLGDSIHFCGGYTMTDPMQMLGSCDALLLCTGDNSLAAAASWGVDCSPKGIVTDTTGMTTIKGVFAAGSCVSRQKHAVRACAQGREAAFAISAYLSSSAFEYESRPYGVRMGQLAKGELAELSKPHSTALRVPDSKDALTDDEVRSETRRCLHCECAKEDGCRLRIVSQKLGADPVLFRAPHRAYTRDISHPEIVFEHSKCISCGLCVQIAQQRAEQLGLTFIGRGFDVELKVPFGAELPEGLKIAAIECAKACPTAALHIKEGGR